MPGYKVRVTIEYPVSSVDARDALKTVPQVMRLKYIGVHAEGRTEIIDVSTGQTVLTAKLNPDVGRIGYARTC